MTAPSIDRSNAPVWNWSDICKALPKGLCDEAKDTKQLMGNPLEWWANGVSIDTRTLGPGDIFLSLCGKSAQGWVYLDQAIAKGARAAIIPHHAPQLTSSIPIVRVQNPESALYELAMYNRHRFPGRVIALTGSVGKTSVKEGLGHVMRGWGQTHVSPGNFNNHLGVPLSLCSLSPLDNVGIFELGMNKPGEILPLANVVKPDIAMVTHVVYQHGAAFDSIHGIIKEKGSIYASEGLKTGIVPYDPAYYSALKHCGPVSLNWISFGADPRADISLIKAIQTPENKTELTFRIGSSVHECLWSMIGAHTYHNALAVVAGAVASGALMSTILSRLSDVRPPCGRGQILNFQDRYVVDESYNAAPAAMIATIEAFVQKPCSGRKYLLLGDMKELGTQEEFYHRQVIGTVNKYEWSHVWLCGEGFMWSDSDCTNSRMSWASTVQNMCQEIITTLQPGDMILVKGARSARTETVIQAMQQKYGTPTISL